MSLSPASATQKGPLPDSSTWGWSFLASLLALVLYIRFSWQHAYPSPWIHLGFSVVLGLSTVTLGGYAGRLLKFPVPAAVAGASFAALPEAVFSVCFWGGFLELERGWFFRWWQWERLAHYPGYLLERTGIGVPQHWSTFTGLTNPPFSQTMVDTARVSLVSGLVWSVVAGAVWKGYKMTLGRRHRPVA